MLLPILLTLLCLCLTYYWINKNKFRSFSSPGLCLPWIGHSHILFSSWFLADPVNSLWKLWKENQKEGFLWVRILSIDNFFVGDFHTLKELFNHPNLQGRLTSGVAKIFKEDRKVKNDKDVGVIFTKDSTWTEQRRFSLRTLRDFGFGKTKMEDMIKEEVELFLDLIKKTEGEPFDFCTKFNLPIVNALWRICLGQKFDYDDPEFILIVKKVNQINQTTTSPKHMISGSYPRLANLFPSFMGRNERIAIHQDILDMISERIKDHEDTRDTNDPRDFTDKALAEIEKTTDPASSFYGAHGKENLTNTLLDLFFAGMETTSTTLTWAMLYMARYPSVQRKVQEELDRVVGTHRRPALEDRGDLPYTEATIMEIQRYANMMPLGLPHYCRSDIKVGNLIIPAGSRVWGLLAELHKGSYWGDGQVFRPERFLDSEGKCRREERLIPFSIGKRQCLGENLAKTELFLFFTGLVQQFSFWPEVEGEPPSEDYINSVTVHPKPFTLRMKERK